jgi:hypothetical protein
VQSRCVMAMEMQWNGRPRASAFERMASGQQVSRGREGDGTTGRSRPLPQGDRRQRVPADRRRASDIQLASIESDVVSVRWVCQTDLRQAT